MNLQQEEYPCVHCGKSLEAWEIYFPPFFIIRESLDQKGIILSQADPKVWQEVMIYLCKEFAFCSTCFQNLRVIKGDQTYDDILGQVRRLLKVPTVLLTYDGYVSQTNPATDKILRQHQDENEQRYYRHQVIAYRGHRLRAA